MSEPGAENLNEQLWRGLSSVDRDSAAAEAASAAGHAIYYIEDDTPEGLLIKEHPDGRRTLVRFQRAGDEVIRTL